MNRTTLKQLSSLLGRFMEHYTKDDVSEENLVDEVIGLVNIQIENSSE